MLGVKKKENQWQRIRLGNWIQAGSLVAWLVQWSHLTKDEEGHCVMTWRGGMGRERRRLKRTGIYIYIYAWWVRTDVWQRPPQHCKAIMLQLKKCDVVYWSQKKKCWSLSRVQLFATPWTVAHQAPLSLGFPRQEYWSGLPFPFSADFPYPEIKPWSPALQADSLPSAPSGKPRVMVGGVQIPALLLPSSWLWINQALYTLFPYL